MSSRRVVPRRDRFAVRARPGRADGRRGRGSSNDARRPVARAADGSAGPGEGLSVRLPTVQARKRAAGHGRGRAMGQAGCASQHDQPRHHFHSDGQGRNDRARWGELPAHDRTLPGRARRHSGRGRNRRGAADRDPTADSSPAATSSWTADSPPPTGSANSGRSWRHRYTTDSASALYECARISPVPVVEARRAAKREPNCVDRAPLH